MAGLDPAIHVFPGSRAVIKSWMPGTRPGMTEFVSPATATATTSPLSSRWML